MRSGGGFFVDGEQVDPADPPAPEPVERRPSGPRTRSAYGIDELQPGENALVEYRNREQPMRLRWRMTQRIRELEQRHRGRAYTLDGELEGLRVRRIA